MTTPRAMTTPEGSKDNGSALSLPLVVIHINLVSARRTNHQRIFEIHRQKRRFSFWELRNLRFYGVSKGFFKTCGIFVRVFTCSNAAPRYGSLLEKAQQLIADLFQICCRSLRIIFEGVRKRQRSGPLLVINRNPIDKTVLAQRLSRNRWSCTR